MPDVNSLLKSAKTAKAIFNLLESGSVASVFLGIEFQAVREAFLRIGSAVDKKGQTQICIGHLDSSYHACEYLIRNAGFLDRLLFSRAFPLDQVRQKARFLLCVRAVCHAFIGERDHCANDLLIAESYRSEDNPLITAWVLSGVLINPLAAADLAYAGIRNLPGMLRGEIDAYNIDDEAIAEFRATLLKPDESPSS